MNKSIEESAILKATEQYPTPFYIYDELGIRKAAQRLKQAFAWSKGYRNYFAVKALPNPKILKIVLSEGMGLDCSSYTELLTAERLGVNGSEIMFSSNDTPPEDFKKARKLSAFINLDDLTHLEFLKNVAGLPDILCFRYNLGNRFQGNDIIGKPEEAKFGMTSQQITEAVQLAQQQGIKRFGLHTMTISSNLDTKVALEITKALFELAVDIQKATGIKLEFINLGGGIGIPYKPSQHEFALENYANSVKKQLQDILHYKPIIYTECGRYVTGPHGYLISKVRHIKRTYKTYLGLDASMHNLMRPGMYKAYHHITVIGKSSKDHTHVYDVTGALCENNDKFAINRKLPEVNIGDIVVIHDAGAHAHAMGFNYNGLLRSAELLLHPDKSIELIRRAETPSDYFATLV